VTITGADSSPYDVGQAASALTAEVTGVPSSITPTYQWYSNTTGTANPSSDTAVGTDPNYTPPTTGAGTKYYYVVVTYTDDEANGIKTATATSSAVAVTVDSLTAVTPATITGVTSPAAGATPSTAIDTGTGFTASLVWNDSPTTFAYNTPYTATITLTANAGYTFTGVSDISGFTVNDVAPNSGATNNGTSLVFTVTFTATAKQTYAVTVNYGTASHTTAAEGDSVTINASTATTGQKFKEWTTTDNNISFTSSTSSTTTFTMPASAVTVTATYESLTYVVTFSVTGGSGTLSATVDGSDISTDATVEHGKNIVFTAVPAAGYKVKSWTLNSSEISGSAADTYT
jgi:hypothetical protein